MERVTIAIANRKGGTGKTTIAVNLAGALSICGANVLYVDADVQAAATQWSAAGDGLGFTVIHMPSKTIHDDLPRLATAYSTVVIDGPASDAEITGSVIRAADFVIVPVIATAIDLWVLPELIVTLRRLGKPGAVLLNRYDGRLNISKDARESIVKLGLPILETTFGSRVAFVEAAVAGTTVLSYAPECHAAQEVRDLAVELGNYVPLEVTWQNDRFV